MLTVSGLRNILQNMLEQLDGYDDNERVWVASNQHHLDNGNYMSLEGEGLVPIDDIIVLKKMYGE